MSTVGYGGEKGSKRWSAGEAGEADGGSGEVSRRVSPAWSVSSSCVSSTLTVPLYSIAFL